jgi:hypothetical protein
MTATKATGQQQQQASQGQSANLDKRYGKIGISAVAAAASVKQQVEKPAPSDRRFTANESD